MAYFNHAFCKSFLVGSVEDAAGVSTSALAAGQLGLVSGGDWETEVAAGASLGAGITDLLYLVQGSYRSDILGGNSTHGGYAESIKSKGINPKYVTRIWKAAASTAAVSSASVEVGPKCHPCGENLMLRLDVKGSPALRFLNRNAYTIGDSMGDASTSNVPGLCCAAGQTYLDPAVALAKMGRMMLEDPITKDFIAEGSYVNTISVASAGDGYSTGTKATTGGSGTGLTISVDSLANTDEVATVSVVDPGTGYAVNDVVTLVDAGATVLATVTITGVHAKGIQINTNGTLSYRTIAEVLDGTYTASTDPVGDNISAKLSFKGAYVSTEFDTASFDTRDFYGKEPVQLRLSMIDETGEPCNDCGTAVHVPGTMPQTTGNQVLRSVLLSERYMQNPVHQGNTDFNRMREIEGSKAIIDQVTLTDLYDVYYVQHSVPRFNNPSSTFDNDQYVYEIFAKQGSAQSTDVSELLTTLLATVNANGGAVKNEL